MLPDFERADRIGEFWSYPESPQASPDGPIATRAGLRAPKFGVMGTFLPSGDWCLPPLEPGKSASSRRLVMGPRFSREHPDIARRPSLRDHGRAGGYGHDLQRSPRLVDGPPLHARALDEDFIKLNGADRRAMLILGLLVIAGAACFIALGSRRMRMTAGALVVLAAAAGAMVKLLADPPSVAGSNGSSARLLGDFGAVLAAGFGIVALLRSGGEPPRSPAAGRSPTLTLDATPAGDVATPQRRRMSDAALLSLIVVAIVIVLVVGFFVVVHQICSEPGGWC